VLVSLAEGGRGCLSRRSFSGGGEVLARLAKGGEVLANHLSFP